MWVFKKIVYLKLYLDCFIITKVAHVLTKNSNIMEIYDMESERIL